MINTKTVNKVLLIVTELLFSRTSIAMFFMHWLIMWIYAIIIFFVIGLIGAAFFYEGLTANLGSITKDRMEAARESKSEAESDVDALLVLPTID